MTTVLAFGTFDILHPGHLYFLKEAKKSGDNLIVVIARDKTVETIKGKKPKYNERERQEHIQELPYVAKAILGSLKDRYEIVVKIKPDVICLGYDQNIAIEELKEELGKRGLNPEIIRIGPYKEHIYKSSKMKFD